VGGGQPSEHSMLRSAPPALRMLSSPDLPRP
jgi:hypothetical protein